MVERCKWVCQSLTSDQQLNSCSCFWSPWLIVSWRFAARLATTRQLNITPKLCCTYVNSIRVRCTLRRKCTLLLPTLIMVFDVFICVLFTWIHTQWLHCSSTSYMHRPVWQSKHCQGDQILQRNNFNTAFHRTNPLGRGLQCWSRITKSDNIY